MALMNRCDNYQSRDDETGDSLMQGQMEAVVTQKHSSRSEVSVESSGEEAASDLEISSVIMIGSERGKKKLAGICQGI